MAEPTPTFANPLAWWGTIVGAVSERVTTAELWQAINDYTAAEGIAQPPGMFAAVNALRSAAVELRDKGAAFQSAAPDTPITADYVGLFPWHRTPALMNVDQQYQMRVKYTTGGFGGLEQRWTTIPYSGADLPGTIGQARADLNDMLTAYAHNYGEELVGIDAVQLGAM